LEEALSAENFVRIRTIYGGPAPDETKEALEEQREAQTGNNAWLLERRGNLKRAKENLDAQIKLALL
jgi:argininosuccinate lyase